MATRSGGSTSGGRRTRRQARGSGAPATDAAGTGSVGALALAPPGPPGAAHPGGDPGGQPAGGQPADGQDDGGYVFTRTAQVPRIGGSPASYYRPPDPRFVNTGVVPKVGPYAAPRRKAPLGLRILVWLVVLLLLAGIAGLVVHKVRPQWLKSLEVATGTSAPAPARPAASAGASHGASSTVTATGSGLAENVTVKVGSLGSYAVVVSAQDPCWVQVNTPASFSPQFSQVMQGGQSQTFKPANGQLTLLVGASHVTVTVVVNGKPAKWSFTPPTAPFTLNFAQSS